MPGVSLAAWMKSRATLAKSSADRLARFCKAHGEARLPAHAAHRRRDEDERARLLGLGELGARGGGDLLRVEARAVALLGVGHDDEDGARVGGVGGRAWERPCSRRWTTPGRASSMSLARFTTSSVRASEAPGGGCGETMRMPRSIFGMNPVGVEQQPSAEPISPR